MAVRTQVPTSFTSVNLQAYVTLTVVRDPLERFLSALNHGWNWTAHFKLSCAHHRHSPCFDFGSGPDAFVQFYLNPRHPFRAFDGDCHLLPQSWYLRDARGNRVAHVMHTANLSVELPRLSHQLGLHLAFPNTSSGWRALSKERSPPKTARRSRLFTAHDLSSASLQLIRAFYADDFDSSASAAPSSQWRTYQRAWSQWASRAMLRDAQGPGVPQALMSTDKGYG